MKVVYFGTPQFAASILQYLLERHCPIKAIVTQPDRPRGRNLQLTSSAVKATAMQMAPEVLIFQPTKKASDPAFLQQLQALQADLFVVVAYGQILSQKLLDIPPLGCINIHASLLPKYRGAAPMQRCLMHGDLETGVTIQKMVFQLDAGDIIDEVRLQISSDTTLGELQEKLCDLSKPLLLSVLCRYESGIPPARPQDHSLATLAPKIQIEETLIRWDRDAKTLHDQVRGLSPRPGAWAWIEVHKERRRLKILRTTIADHTGRPSEIIAFSGDTCIIATGRGALQLLQIQPEGKKIMSSGEWMRGLQQPPVFV